MPCPRNGKESDLKANQITFVEKTVLEQLNKIGVLFLCIEPSPISTHVHKAPFN